MPDSIRISVPSHDVARQVAAALEECRVEVRADDGTPYLEVICDREFNELLLHVLDGTQAYLASDPTVTLRLEVDGRSYALHPPPPRGAERADV